MLGIDGILYLYDPLSVALMRVQNGQAEVLEGVLPDFLFAKDGEPGDSTVDDPYVGQAVLAVATEGIVLVGPPAKDGSSDTFILKKDADTFTSYAKRASDARVFSTAAATYRGRLFVIGSSTFEPNNRLFRATAISVPEYPGDIPCDDTPLTPTKPTAPMPKTSDNLPPWLPFALVNCAVAAGAIALVNPVSQSAR